MMKKVTMKHYRLMILVLIIGGFSGYSAACQSWEEMAPPKENGIWLQPAQGMPAQAVWGFRDGIRIGLAPMPGPRGLLRIYTPYLGHEPGKMMNFIAVEPIPAGSPYRGLSELEMSSLENARGKRMWSTNTDKDYSPGDVLYPAEGVIQQENGVETLTFYVFVEPFDNGIDTYVKVKFYADRPYEVELSTYLYGDSGQPDHIILTATMGNYARLRNLHLDKEVLVAGDLWPDYHWDAFTEHHVIPSSGMIKSAEGYAYFIASVDEKHPEKATYAASTRTHWKYYGKKATQYWYIPDASVEFSGLVNGRFTYWASKSPIPGGIAYENFELKRAYADGQTFIFGITPQKPKKLITDIKKD